MIAVVIDASGQFKDDENAGQLQSIEATAEQTEEQQSFIISRKSERHVSPKRRHPSGENVIDDVREVRAKRHKGGQIRIARFTFAPRRCRDLSPARQKIRRRWPVVRCGGRYTIIGESPPPIGDEDAMSGKLPTGPTDPDGSVFSARCAVPQ
uniref:Uncharacterized protein n=1 Tax=Plectus sambesii TaxID=2011161 RepID=A0A914WIS9_9BILA